MTETRATEEGRINRRRRCPKCKHNFMTVERLSEAGLFVEKASGDHVPFSREAVRSSIQKAVVVHRYDEPRLEAVVDDVVADVYRQAEGPIPSAEIGASVLRHLGGFNEATRIRFALVYSGRHDRADRLESGWSAAQDVHHWLVKEYPQLQYFRPPHPLSEVVKRSGRRVGYVRSKLEKSIDHSAKGQGSREKVQQFAREVADEVERELGSQPLVTTGQIASEVMRVLRRRNHVAYLRYASVIKDFKTPEDYEAETNALSLNPTNRVAG